MSWIGPAISAAGSVLGGILGGGDREVNNEPWSGAQPYMRGRGDIPPYIQGNPLINTNWLDYIRNLGTSYGPNDTWQPGQWQPMTMNSPWFDPSQTFTPGPSEPGYPYGTPSGPNGTPPGGTAPETPPAGAGGMPQAPYWGMGANSNDLMFPGGASLNFFGGPDNLGAWARQFQREVPSLMDWE